MARRRRVTYKPNHREFGQFILSAQMRDVTAEVARDIAKTAAALTPVGEGPGPHMRDRFKVIATAGVLKVGGNLRVMVKIVNDDPGSGAVEFGGKNNQAVRMLGRAGAKFGDFKPEPGPVVGQRGKSAGGA